jgi:hypothetical protein
MATEVTMADIRVDLAAHLTHAPSAVPDTGLGQQIYLTLRASLPDAGQTIADDVTDDAWSTAPRATWGSTRPNNAVRGIATLTMRQEWLDNHGNELTALVTPFLDSPNPTYRYLASKALPGLYPEPHELFGELRRRLLTETDRHVATYLLDRLARFRSSHAIEIDSTLQQLASRPEWACMRPDQEADHRNRRDDRWPQAVNLLAILAAVHTTPYADAVIRTWLSHPIQHPNRAAQATACLRGLLNPADAALWSAQEQAFQLLKLSLSQVRDVWAASTQPGHTTAELQEQTSRAISIASNIGEQLYFSSGAFDTATPDRVTPKGDLRRFSAFALPLLEGLAAIGHPAVTHQIVQTIDHLRPLQPRSALLIAAQAVTGDPAYVRESLGLDAVHLLVRHYLFDHRELVLGNSTCLSAIRTMLEAFLRVGWDKTIELAEDLDDLFASHG